MLRNRRSMTKSRPDPVPRNIIEAVIEAGTWGPNHRKTEPWRFVVLTGKAREELGEVMAQALVRRTEEEGPRPDEEKVEKERTKPLRAPVVIAVAAEPNPDPRTVEVEEIAATAAGIENMLLAAQALGLGAMWRMETRPPIPRSSSSSAWRRQAISWRSDTSVIPSWFCPWFGTVLPPRRPSGVLKGTWTPSPQARQRPAGEDELRAFVRLVLGQILPWWASTMALAMAQTQAGAGVLRAVLAFSPR